MGKGREKRKRKKSTRAGVDGRLATAAEGPGVTGHRD